MQPTRQLSRAPDPTESRESDRPIVRRRTEADRLANALAASHFLLLRAVNDGVRMRLARASIPLDEAAGIAELLADASRLLRRVRAA